jgi:hypothetical protein
MKLIDILKEGKSPSYQTGFKAGPNGDGKLDTTTKEGQYISDKVNQLYTLLNDKTLIDFAKGYVNSIGSRQVRYEGLDTVAKMLLYAKQNQ